MGFYPALRGRVLLDGADVAQLDAETLRGHMALVPQEPFLFSGSVADNIAFGREGASRQDVEQIVDQYGMTDLLAKCPDGLDAIVDSGGRTLSSGQRQIVALMRALIADPALLLLDEATSVLDAETESLLQKALDQQRGSRTTISIAHRMELCASADQILVVVGGRLVENGSHEQLLSADGEYAKMWRAS